ncbi:hypothetical protein Afil01_56250 [Actinorhabdospora filicis]|uniref:Cell wall protein n=1 Tax=Actinorhabdospora filicis TaxID=1785913 RepID=A0A9W6SRM0_9ACTN|nr:cell wall protein [Actinorhabdospora filicis]GLZ80818.1 hypothetical protein Afil01_56250 [Actinorhabdospora filicis]
MDRRRLLTTAVLGGAAGLVGATALGSLSPEDVWAAEGANAKINPGDPDPNFVEGRVTAVSDAVVFVTSSDGTYHSIRVTTGTSIWKLNPSTLDEVKVGDGLYARGVRMPDNTLAADSLWVNIVNLNAHVDSIGRGHLNLDHHGQRVVAHVEQGRSAAVYNNTPAVSDMSMLQAGKHVKVIGAWHPDTNEITISTVYAAV